MNYPRYSEYKPSGVEWLGEVPAHWVVKRLKYLGHFKAGAGFPHEEQGQTENELPFFKVKDLAGAEKDGYMRSTDSTVTMATAEQLGAHIFPKDSVVFAKVGAALLLNRFRLLGQPSCIDNNMMGFELSSKFDLRFVFYAIGRVNFADIVNPGAVPSINESHIGNQVFSLPPVEEQHTIADFLDRETARIDALIARKQRLIELLAEKRTALISQAVTKGLNPDAPMKNSGVEWLDEIPAHWQANRLKFVLASPLKYGANESAELDDPALPRYIRITDIDEQGNLREDTFKSLPEEAARPYLLEDGDLLLARSGATVGKTFLYHKDWGKAAYAGYLIRARFDGKKCLSRFATYMTQSREYWGWLGSSFIQATIQNVSAEKYANFVMPCPPINEQQEAVAFLDSETSKLDSLCATVELAVERFREYRAALITDAVTGKIDVRSLTAEREVA